MDNTTKITLLNKPNCKIIKTKFMDLGILDYLTFYDDNIVITLDITTLLFRKEVSRLDDSELCKCLLEHVELCKNTYLNGVKDGDVFKALIYCDRRDLKMQCYKLMLNRPFNDLELYKYFRYAYKSIEMNQFEIVEFMKVLIKHHPFIKKFIMKEFEKFNIVDEEFIVYRGVRDLKVQDKGTSFTLDYNVAEKFSKRFDSNGEVRTYKIKKEDLLACYFDEEKEFVTNKAIRLK